MGLFRFLASCTMINGLGKKPLRGFSLIVLATLTWTCFLSLTLIADSLPPYEKNSTCHYDNRTDCVIQTITPFTPTQQHNASAMSSAANMNNYSHQALQHAPQVSNPISQKVILRWTRFYNNPWEFPEGSYIFNKLSCPVRDCVISDDKAGIRDADAILFHMRDLEDPAQLPTFRDPEQRWIFYLLESPFHTQVNLSKFNGVFNWTSTYSSASDVPTPYGQFTAYSHISSNSSVRDLTKVYPGKTRPIAWFVTNCKAQNKRMEYVQELRNYLPVDIYGNCGNFRCKNRDKCLDMLKQKYKFYLAFENSNCAEYITEKFWFNALEHDIVPIVMGAPRSHYQRLTPPSSFIHVDDFPTIRDLARYLRMLLKNSVLYNEFFRWRTMGKSYTHINLQPATSLYWCDLCAALNNDKLPAKTYWNIDQWWSVGHQCTT